MIKFGGANIQTIVRFNGKIWENTPQGEAGSRENHHRV
jgi:hypothetical protein